MSLGSLVSRRAPVLISARYISVSHRLSYPRKDTQDRGSILTESTEYSQSGSDSESAHSAAAFDPKTTGPGEQHAQDRTNGNPLDVSPANHHVDKPRESEQKGASSTAGSPNVSGSKSSGGKSTGKATGKST